MWLAALILSSYVALTVQEAVRGGGREIDHVMVSEELVGALRAELAQTTWEISRSETIGRSPKPHYS